MLSKAVEEVPRPFDADRSPGLLEWRTLKVSKVWHSSRTAARGEQGPELRDRLVDPARLPEPEGQVAAGRQRGMVVGAEDPVVVLEQGPAAANRLVHPPCFPEERGQVAAGPERVEVVGAENLDHLA